MAKELEFREVVEWRGYAVEWHQGGQAILSQGSQLFRADGCGQRPEYWVSFPVERWKSRAIRFRLVQRLMRAMFYNVIPISGEQNWHLVGFGRQLFQLRQQKFSAIVLPRPTRILRNCYAQTPDGRVWFGEYWDNATRGEMSIYCLDLSTGNCEVVYTFPKGEIYHIHSMTWDPIRSALICLTGDRRGECRILLSRDGCKTFENIGGGSEDWRAVSIISVATGWLFATDAEFQQNRIIHIDCTTGKRSVLGELPGPVYYSRYWGGDALFSVTAERCPAMKVPAASLVRVDENMNVSTLATFSKDINTSRLAWRLFLPGTLNFANGAGHANYVYVSGVALRGADNRCFLVQRSKNAHSRPEIGVG